ncbi:HlyD family secretion protein [Aminipila sp.]|uniref:HlyD family secretion protein n=1 Tax=Aminipila sp. TaxID=2060095 RepID=UPI0028A071F1|nr:HlyD family efflux transporter periplasmic adaptor subunit [Aminipila sp.]
MNRIKESKKAVIIIAILLILTALYYFFSTERDSYTGEVEGTMISHAAEVSGKILECPVQLGSPVKKGDILAVIDSTNQKYVIEQLELNLQKAQLEMKNSKMGKGGTADNNYTFAKANYDSAVAIAEKAKKDYNKAESLYKEAAISKDELDSAKVAYETAASAAEAAKAQVDNSSDRTAGKSADINTALLESQLNQQKIILDKYTIAADSDGIIMSKNYSVGDVVAAGYNIADISPAEEHYAVIYYPKDKLDQIHYNQKAEVFYKKGAAEGTIKFIDVKAQYTPKELQNAANRNQESVRVKILLPKECKVNIGQKIEVKL